MGQVNSARCGAEMVRGRPLGSVFSRSERSGRGSVWGCSLIRLGLLACPRAATRCWLACWPVYTAAGRSTGPGGALWPTDGQRGGEYGANRRGGAGGARAPLQRHISGAAASAYTFMFFLGTARLSNRAGWGGDAQGLFCGYRAAGGARCAHCARGGRKRGIGSLLCPAWPRLG